MPLPVCNYQDLGRPAQKVKCPACGNTEETIRIRQALSALRIFGYAWIALWSLGTFICCCFWKGPHCDLLVHYCGHCGIRLFLFGDDQHRRFLSADQLVNISDPQNPKQSIRMAPSPFPFNQNLVQETDFDKWQNRYKNQVPSVSFWVKNGKNQLPAEFLDEGENNTLFQVQYKDFDLKTTYKPENCWLKKGASYNLPAPNWTPDNATIRVISQDTQKDAGLMQLHPSTWDLRFYFPTQGESSHIQTYRNTSVMPDKNFYDRKLPFLHWKSSQGSLVWTDRLCTDAREYSWPHHRKHLVLLDSYDRLVAMEYTALEEGKFNLRAQLRFYGDLSDLLIGEIVTSYVALYAQMKREYDYSHMD